MKRRSSGKMHANRNSVGKKNSQTYDMLCSSGAVAAAPLALWAAMKESAASTAPKPPKNSIRATTRLSR